MNVVVGSNFAYYNRATFVVTNFFAIMDLKNSRRNAKNHVTEIAPEMAAANGTGNTTTATTNNADSAV